MSIDDILSGVGTEPPPRLPPPPEVEELPLEKELVIEREKPRQAGAAPALDAATPWVNQKRTLAEGSLYFFTKAVLRRKFLTSTFHQLMCAWLQQCPPRRKLALWPREHGKTTIVGNALPLHVLVQHPKTNIYFPGEDGAEQRVILMCETEKMVKDRIRVMQTELETNATVRAFWPERVWHGNPKSLSKKWDALEFIIPRKHDWLDPTVRGVGVGGAIAGAHPSVLVKDDLITFEAMNSEAVMQEAKDYHLTSRALIGKPNCLEFIIGTHWSPFDLYVDIIEKDPTVESMVRSIVEDGQPIWPEWFPLKRVEELQAEHGAMFWLYYMNSVTDAALNDFDLRMVRNFSLVVDEGQAFIEILEDERDALLADRQKAPRPNLTSDLLRGKALDAEAYDIMKSRVDHLGALRMQFNEGRAA